MGKISGEEGFISLGPWGAKPKRGETYWAYKADGPILQITISYGDIIDAILFESKNSDGVLVGNSGRFGGSDARLQAFCIDTSVEQLSSIKLTYGDYYGEVTIGSLYFCTNLNTYGVTGNCPGASSVSIPIEGGVFAGFHGCAGRYINAFGVFVAPKVDHKKIEEKMKTEIRDLKTKIKELEEREDGLLAKMKDVEAQNEMLMERNKVLDKVLFDLHVTIKRSGAIPYSTN